MHPRVLSPRAWRSVRRLAAAGCLDSWTLCGGTALALQLGHRSSEDLDFFRHEPFDRDRLLERISAAGRLGVSSWAEGTLHLTFEGLRVSFLRAEAPLLFPGIPYRGLLLADPRDIAVMKLIAIGGRGSRKDFVDLHFYLRGADGLGPLFSLVRRRFPRTGYSEYHLLKSLVYFEDAEKEPMPRMLRRVTWREVREAMAAEVRRAS